MDLELTRIDYGNVGTTTANCLKLLPNEYKKQQKIVVGDLDGNFQIFSIKKSEAQVHFQQYVGKKISCIKLGGILGTPMDKMFVANENIVKGFNKKGKMFLSFDTNLTEPIKCMYVSGADLITCGNHVYSHYRDCKDIGTYLCGDNIVDVAALLPNNTNRILTILACSGRVLRVLEHCRVRQIIELDSVPTVLHVPQINVLGDRILCGFADGKIIMFFFGHFTGDVKQQIIINPSENPSAVTCIDTYDITGDGKDELIIGRRDGTIQVFTLPVDDDLDVESRQIYKECYSESISAIQGGCVYSNNFTELVVLSYSGNIFGLTSQVISISFSDKDIIKEPLNKRKLKANVDNDKNESVSDELQNEFNENNVKLSLVKPRENYRLQTQVVTQAVTTSTMLEINDSLTLLKEDGSYHLYIEMPVPISEILFNSQCSIELIEDEESSAEIINNEPELGTNYQFSITAKIKGNKNRYEMKFKTIEGQYGNLEAYIVPSLFQANSVIQPKSYLIKPLSLHMRIHTFDNKRPFNVLTLKGQFSQPEMHNWIEQCVPEVPERVAIGENSELYFKNVLIGTILECKYSKEYAIFRSDNLSTISILKDFLTKEATKKRIKLEITSEISEPSIPHVLKLIEPIILNCNKIKYEHKFLLALLQVNIRNEDDFNCLIPEYQLILNRKIDIEENYKKIPSISSRFFGIVTDFYIDRFKFKGIFVKDKVPELVKLLDNYKFEEILDYFNNIKKNEENKKEFSN